MNEIKEIMNGNVKILNMRVEGETIGFDTPYNSNWNFMPRDFEQIIDTLQQENARLKEENQALLTLVNWFEECGMGFDNIAQDDIINWEKFEEETEDMGYIESMIYYAKKYNEKQNLKEN